MEGGKPAGVRCINLMDDYRCAVYNDPGYPKVCAGFNAETGVLRIGQGRGDEDTGVAVGITGAALIVTSIVDSIWHVVIARRATAR